MTLEKFFEVMFKADMKPKKTSDGVIFSKILPDHFEMVYARVNDEGEVYIYFFFNTEGVFCPLDDVSFQEGKNGCSLRVSKDSAIAGIEPPEGVFKKEMRRILKKWQKAALINL